MYNKHTNTKTVFTVIIENKIAISFNTEKKRKTFIARLKGTRQITCITDSSYPWNPEEGIHNLISPTDFAERVGIKDVNRVTRAIRKGKIKTEILGDNAYIVEKHGHCYINGITTNIEN